MQQCVPTRIGCIYEPVWWCGDDIKIITIPIHIGIWYVTFKLKIKFKDDLI